MRHWARPPPGKRRSLSRGETASSWSAACLFLRLAAADDLTVGRAGRVGRLRPGGGVSLRRVLGSLPALQHHPDGGRDTPAISSSTIGSSSVSAGPESSSEPPARDVSSLLVLVVVARPRPRAPSATESSSPCPRPRPPHRRRPWGPSAGTPRRPVPQAQARRAPSDIAARQQHSRQLSSHGHGRVSAKILTSVAEWAPRDLDTTLRQHGPAALVALSVFAAAIADGGFDPIAYAAASIVIWVAVLAGLLSRALPAAPVAAPAAAAGLCLAAIVVLAAASVGWAGDQGRAFEESVRASTYLGLFTLAACTASSGARGQWIGGLAAGLGAVSVMALLSHLQPGLLGERGARGPHSRRDRKAVLSDRLLERAGRADRRRHRAARLWRSSRRRRGRFVRLRSPRCRSRPLRSG